MELEDITSDARDVVSAKRVYGEPYEKNGLTVIPAATITGIYRRGAGDDGSADSGGGDGFGLTARPSGAWVLHEGSATWRPAVDVNRIIFGGQVIALIAIVVTGRILTRHSKRRGASSVVADFASIGRLLLQLPKFSR
jgi:uncharacterized spore protein YtfJ